MLPEDVDPDSRCRLSLPQRAEFDALGQKLFDNVMDPKGGTIRGLKGPSGIQLHSPGLTQHARPLNRYLRYEAGLGGRVRELAILTTARECDSQFEWAAHENEALREGISPQIIEIVKHRRDTQGLDEADANIIELGRAIFGARHVAPAIFARAMKQFGRRKLVDLVSLMGNYAATAALLTAFDMQLDEGQAPLLPPRR
jgi:4-carboxymuconolactone decarboxylase